MAQQLDLERRIAENEKDIQKIEKAMWGNGGCGMKDKLNRIETQQKMMLKLGWLVLSVTIVQVTMFVMQNVLK